MRTKSFASMECSIARALEQVGSWWSLLIIREAMTGSRRFKHFEQNLGIAKNTLTTRLSQLVEAGILERVSGSDGSAFDEYALTQRGHELGPVLLALKNWGDKWAPDDGGECATVQRPSAKG